MEPINPESSKASNKMWMWLVIIAIPVGILAYMLMNKPAVDPLPQTALVNTTVIDDEILVPVEEQQPATSTQQPVAITNASYKNGNYSAIGDYISPGGAEQVGVTLTLTDDIITDVNFEVKAERPVSLKRQEAFAADYKQFVVGKKINEVELTKVSGSSLTSKGFNDALAKIKAEAKS